MTYVEEPATYRTGVFQLRPALLGWQYRTRPYGQTWGSWRFVFGRQKAVREHVQAVLGRAFVEVPYQKAVDA